MSALRDQTEPVGILRELARSTWAKANDGAECPPALAALTPADLAAWLPECPESAGAEAIGRDEALGFIAGDVAGYVTGGRAPGPSLGMDLPALFAIAAPGRGAGAAKVEHCVRYVHRRWLAYHAGALRMESTDDNLLRWTAPPVGGWPAVAHPLAPLVAAWQAAQPIERDRRRHGIAPDSWRDARYHDHLPLLQRPYPEAPGKMAGDQHLLPLVELETPSVVVPVLPLVLYDSGAGPLATRGRGAPYAQRLFVEILLDVGRLDRVPGQTARVEVPLRDLVAWLWPKRWQRTRSGDRPGDLEQLQRALLELDGTRILWDRMLWRLVGVQALPTTTTRLDDVIVFRVEHLPGSEHGPMIDRDLARRWGAVSAPAWRGTIRLAYLWDKAKGMNNGARIYATRPVVARGAGGVILGADGKPLRDRRGAVVKDWSDRRAVILSVDGKPAGSGPPAYERNPAADRVPVLGPDDLIRLTYDNNLDLSAGTLRKRLHDAREALRAKEAAGEVVIETDNAGWRIIETRPDR